MAVLISMWRGRVMALVWVVLVAHGQVASAQIRIGEGGAGTATGAPLTVGTGAGGLVVVAVAVREASTNVNAVTLGGRALQRIGDLPGDGCSLSLWSLVAPASGTRTLAARLSPSTAEGVMVAMAYEGVDPTSAKALQIAAIGATRSISITSASAAGDLSVGVACARGSSGVSVGSEVTGQRLGTAVTVADLAAVLSDKTGTGSVTLTWPVTGSTTTVSWSATSMLLRPATPYVAVDAGQLDAAVPDVGGRDRASPGLATPDLAGDPPPVPIPAHDAGERVIPEDAGSPSDGPAGVGTVELHVVGACSLHRGEGAEVPAFLFCVGVLLRQLRRRRR